MALHQRNCRWPAGALLLVLAALYIWIGRRPFPGGPAVPEPTPPESALVESAAPSHASPPAVAPAPGQEARPSPVPDPVATPPLLSGLPPRFGFPTDNRGLLDKVPDRFFMFVDRYTPSGQIQVWQGGDYGFVRNPRETVQGTVYTKFHEGIDIAPVARDAKGEPLDEVRAVADGTVAYLTSSARTSNYGNYLVVLHQIGDTGVFYSLYAHLRSAAVAAGTSVRRGDKIGILGYTGDGIDKRRAHVHLEIGLILSERFDAYYGKAKGLANGHGNYHGSNLIGLNAAIFLSAHHDDPQLMPDDFLRRQEIYYKVCVPNRGQELELVGRYPWLRLPGPAGPSWEISFTGPGVPVAVASSNQTVAFSTVSWVKPFAGYHSWNTRSLLGGSGTVATLTAEGSRFISLVAGDF